MSASDIHSEKLKSLHAHLEINPDPPFEVGLSEFLKSQYGLDGLVEMYARFEIGAGCYEQLMRRAVWRALAKRFGNGNRIGSGAHFKHIETFEVGHGVFVGEQS